MTDEAASSPTEVQDALTGEDITHYDPDYIWIIMGNDFPLGVVLENEEAADKYVAYLKEKNEREIRELKRHTRIYYRHYKASVHYTLEEVLAANPEDR